MKQVTQVLGNLRPVNSQTPARVLVTGAGPTGLTAAWKLADRGFDVAIVERGSVVGGMSASFTVAGQRVDFGSHRLHGKADPELLDELGQLMGSDLQARQRNGRIRLAGSWVGFPLRAADLVRHLPRRFALGAGFDSLTAPLRKPDGDDFASQVRAGLGPTVFDSFYGPYARKLWGVDASELDGAMADRRVSAGGPIDILKRLVAARAEDGRVFYYPRNGYGQICEALAGAATSAGAQLMLGTTVDELSFKDHSVSVHTTSDNGSKAIPVDAVVSTVPATALVKMSRPAAGDEVIAAANSLEQRGMVFVYLVVPRSQYTEFDAHYFPGPDTVIARLSEPKNYRTANDPAGQTVLCAEIACTVGDHIWEMSHDDLGALVAKDLEQQGLPHPEHIEVRVRCLPSVYPVYRRQFSAHLDVIENWASEQPRLLTVGRQGLFVPDNLHHAIAMGKAAARSITTDGLIDQSTWAIAREEFRSHVVED